MRAPRGTVVVTGASGGIGRACALDLASEEGFAVVGTVPGAEEGERLVADSGGRVAAVRMDLMDPASIEAAASQVVGLVGDRGIQGLVVDAGIGVPELLPGTSHDAIRREFDVVSRLHATTEAFVPLLRRARGRVVSIGPLLDEWLPIAMASPYRAYRRAVEELDGALRDELAHAELHVALVESGPYDGMIWAAEREDIDYAPRTAALERRITAVTRAVAHALTAPKPRVRYVVSRLRFRHRVLVRLLPWRWRLRLLRRQLWR